ncbi:hypothetical protein [Chamaesiphon sp. OTE_75_metabat_556]|uniref:hypothetical protein n=1 Tax=Chamaesiphon sp. OTE_75_metabat_556 TaxID=2964692 RepID=UPI00286BF9F0|nr:hypothetical protein [Chamaesiphon sp. OTE_75_metabat_556]
MNVRIGCINKLPRQLIPQSLIVTHLGRSAQFSPQYLHKLMLWFDGSRPIEMRRVQRSAVVSVGEV